MGQYDFVITPQETRYVPAGAKEIIDIGQRVCDSSTMIEAAKCRLPKASSSWDFA